jgi:hypothetical protein
MRLGRKVGGGDGQESEEMMVGGQSGTEGNGEEGKRGRRRG